MTKNLCDYVRRKVKQYNPSTIYFTKQKLLDWLAARNNCTINDLKKEICNPIQLVHVEKQLILHAGVKEERYRCYFVYSGSKGRCFILKFNSMIKVITVFPLGRTTLRKYRKRFK